MRKLFPILAVCGLFLGASLAAMAAEDKTITGAAKCAKCSLKEAKDCQNVVAVKEGDKTVNYYMDMTNKVAKDNHAKAGFCQATKNVKVTGEVTEKDGKKFISPTAITVAD